MKTPRGKEKRQETVARRAERGKFAKGTAPGPGRPAGRPNLSTLLGKEMMKALGESFEDLPTTRERWKRLLSNPDPRVRLEAERFVYRAAHGLPRDGDEPVLPAAPPKIVIEYVNNWRAESPESLPAAPPRALLPASKETP